MTSTLSIRPIVITLGDPAGIGPEIIAKAFRDAPELLHGCFVAGDVAILRRAVQFITHEGDVVLPLAQIDRPQAALNVPLRCLPVLQISERHTPVQIAQVSGVAGKIAGDSALWAVRAALDGTVAAMVTAPLHKEALAAAGRPYAQYPGHTELLQAEAAEIGRAHV